MSAPNLPQWLTRLVVIIALPTIACFGFYSIDYLDQENSYLILPTILSYPLALIGLIGLVSNWRSSPSTLSRTFWILLMLTPLLFLSVIRS